MSCIRKIDTAHYYEQVCKPDSVVDSHLSRPIVANGLKPPPECGRADLAIKRSPPTVLLRIEFTAVLRLRAPGELLPHLSTLTPAIDTCQPTRRYISVALVLKSPSAGVTRYPCPAEPGLSS